MKLVSTKDKVGVALFIVGVGILTSIAFYVAGLALWALIGLAFIPFAFGCWALSLLTSSSRLREIRDNLTDEERQRYLKMVSTYAHRITVRTVPLVVLFLIAVLALCMLQPAGPAGAVDFLVRHQAELALAALVLVVVLVIINLPAMIKEHRAQKAFFAQTEYAKQKELCAASPDAKG
jgi:hypothetical protein